MAKRTVQDQLSEALIKQGLEGNDVPTRPKWRKFGPAKSGNFYFVGPAGALRVGKKISDTHSIKHTKLYNQLLRSVD